MKEIDVDRPTIRRRRQQHVLTPQKRRKKQKKQSKEKQHTPKKGKTIQLLTDVQTPDSEVKYIHVILDDMENTNTPNNFDDVIIVEKKSFKRCLTTTSSRRSKEEGNKFNIDQALHQLTRHYKQKAKKLPPKRYLAPSQQKLLNYTKK
mmetsp:Transcript_8853/g.13143  ORF Transcript_8853/g.13143 Transcript_8853/m.13143 type:complete len:148 (-) Transcript_8853:2869-3312(-)